MNKSWDFFSKIYIEGGNIPERLFVSGYDETPEQFADRLLMYNLTELLHESAVMLKESGRFTVLEKLCDNMLMSYVREAKYIAFGVEPLVAYLAAKESEVKIVRIVMAGKLAGLSAELIRERIRDTYV
jgi:V/A-type H+-transporting ATPase subunit C